MRLTTTHPKVAFETEHFENSSCQGDGEGYLLYSIYFIGSYMNGIDGFSPPQTRKPSILQYGGKSFPNTFSAYFIANST